jgi:hypothetical protein
MTNVEWNAQITPKANHTMHQWMVAEAIRAQRWATYYWDAIDEENEREVTNHLIKQYELVCDWIDELANFPEGAYHSAP